MKTFIIRNSIFILFFLSISFNAQITTIEATLDTPCVALKLIDTNIENFQIYPNPTNDKIFIDLKNQSNKPYSIRIYDVKGSLIFDKKESFNNEVINLNKLKSGIYFITLKSEQKKVTKKLIIQK